MRALLPCPAPNHTRLPARTRACAARTSQFHGCCAMAQVVSENVFSQYVYKTLPTCNHLWMFKKTFCMHMALSGACARLRPLPLSQTASTRTGPAPSPPSHTRTRVHTRRPHVPPAVAGRPHARQDPVCARLRARGQHGPHAHVGGGQCGRARAHGAGRCGAQGHAAVGWLRPSAPQRQFTL